MTSSERTPRFICGGPAGTGQPACRGLDPSLPRQRLVMSAAPTEPSPIDEVVPCAAQLSPSLLPR